MSGHGYTYSGGYTTDNSTVPPGKEEWSKTSYTSDVGTQQLHVTKTEIAEVPNFVPGYKQSTPAKVDALIDYGDGDQGKWNSSSNQVRFQEDKQYGPSSPMVATNSIQTPNPHSYHANTGSGNQSKSSKEGQNPGVYTLGGGGGGGGGGYTPVGGGGHTLGGGPVTRESCLVQRSYCFRKYPGTRV